jgi:hypothetical protein
MPATVGREPSAMVTPCAAGRKVKADDFTCLLHFLGACSCPHFELKAMLALGQSRHPSARRWIALTTAVMLAACTSLQTVPIEAGRAPEGVAPGDTVTVNTARGETLEFEVVRVDSDALVGEDTRVAFEDIATLEVEKPEPVKTVGLVAGGVVTTIVVVLGALALVLAAGLTATGG